MSPRKRDPDSRGGKDNSWPVKSIPTKNQAARKGEERTRATTNALWRGIPGRIERGSDGLKPGLKRRKITN
jgi:hypothetical protein